MFESGSEALIEYYLDKLVTHNQALALADELRYSGPRCRGNKARLIRELRDVAVPIITIGSIRNFASAHWAPITEATLETHKKVLKSGLLKGHTWHQMTPNTLHHHFQEKVRAVARGEMSLESFFELGKDLARHEYFMTAVADLCEALFVGEFGAIPPVKEKAVSDFVLEGLPYDLKCTRPRADQGWSIAAIKGNPKGFAEHLFEEASTGRRRKDAENSINNWALNRFFIIVEDELWEKDPEGVLGKIRSSLNLLGEPMEVLFDGKTARSQLVLIEG